MTTGTRFTNQAFLGKGGTAEVRSAFDQELGIPVALKAVSAPEGMSERGKSQLEARMMREIKTLQKLNHPNIVKCYGLVEGHDGPVMISELLEGSTLEDEILNGRIIGDYARILHVFKQVCEGLEYARKNGIVHRDVKPGNIFICRTGDVKMIDFGIARVEDAPSLTSDGQVLGTPEFMSPEQTLGKRADHRTDVFSLGTVLYLSASGRFPFQWESGAGRFVIEAAVREQPMIAGVLPTELEQVVGRALAKNPKDRFKTFAELKGALERSLAQYAPLLQQQPEAAPVPADSPAPAPSQPKSNPRRPVAVPAIETPVAAPMGIDFDSSNMVFPLVLTGFGAILLVVNMWLGLGFMVIGLIWLMAVTSTPTAGTPPLREAIRKSPPHIAGGIAPHPGPVPSRGVALRCTLNGAPIVSSPSPQGVFIVGRQPGCHLILNSDGRISGQHLTIRLSNSSPLIRVEDHSTNGTFVNGQRVTTCDIRPGTPIRLGVSDLVVDAWFAAG